MKTIEANWSQGYTTCTDVTGLQEGVLKMLSQKPHTMREVQNKLTKSKIRSRIPGYSFFLLQDAVEELAVLGMVDAPKKTLEWDDTIAAVGGSEWTQMRI